MAEALHGPMSGNQLAELCGVARRTICRWRAGGRVSSWWTLDRVCTRIGVSPYLFDEIAA